MRAYSSVSRKRQTFERDSHNRESVLRKKFAKPTAATVNRVLRRVIQRLALTSSSVRSRGSFGQPPAGGSAEGSRRAETRDSGSDCARVAEWNP
jgi:hypothetical protein